MTEQTDTAQAVVDALGLTISAMFVPLSQSRNAKEKYPTLNWRVTLKRGERVILETDYSAGLAHCPAYNSAVYRKDSWVKQKAIARECETGCKARSYLSSLDSFTSGPAIMPNALDVIHSLIMDADVIDYATFEDWASSCGYDTDSRDAERIYRACLEYALRLRSAIGDEGMVQLREAFQDY